MEITDNMLGEDRCWSWARYVEKKGWDQYETNWQLKVLECDMPILFITQILHVAVHQRLRGLKLFRCKCLYTDTVYFLSIMTVCIFLYQC